MVVVLVMLWRRIEMGARQAVRTGALSSAVADDGDVKFLKLETIVRGVLMDLFS